MKKGSSKSIFLALGVPLFDDDTTWRVSVHSAASTACAYSSLARRPSGPSLANPVAPWRRTHAKTTRRKKRTPPTTLPAMTPAFPPPLDPKVLPLLHHRQCSVPAITVAQKRMVAEATAREGMTREWVVGGRAQPIQLQWQRGEPR